MYDDEIQLLERSNKVTLKERIQALNNGWTKEADDILNEIGFAGDLYIPCSQKYNSSALHIRDQYGTTISRFSFITIYYIITR